MKTLIIEDEYPAAERLAKMLHKADSNIEILATTDSIEETKKWLTEHDAPDLIFSDIQLADGLSFRIFEEAQVKSPLIFTTSYDEYAIKAFKLQSIDYLLKPIKQQELESALNKFKKMQQTFSANNQLFRLEALLESLKPASEKKYKTRFLVKQHEQLIPVSQEQIAYFYTANEMVCLVRADGKQFLVDFTLEELEKILDIAYFFRLNRQFIAAMPAISKIHTYFNGKLKLELSPELSQEVIVSREKAQTFKEWIENT